jgi:endoglucanase
MRLSVCAAVFLGSAMALAGDNAGTAIKVDQVGYPVPATKVALVTAPSAQTFTVRRVDGDAVVFSGPVAGPIQDANSGDSVRAADFSALRVPGEYYLEMPGVGRSWNFSVGQNVYGRAYYLVMRAFYGQRCGTAVDLGGEFRGYAHRACHLAASFHPSSGRRGDVDVRGGWHDAGDYGRYLPSSGIATGTLLWSWEMFGPQLKNITLHIPESGNGTPDLLNEARWNLEWMLRMQDADGGVWQKQTGQQFAGFIAPDADLPASKIIGTGAPPYKGTCATADLAAVAAIAARTYQPFDPAFARRNLDAARRAWQWAERYPNIVFSNPRGIATGEYGDSQCQDERLWAAAELWRTTGDSIYHRFFLANFSGYLGALASPPGGSWADLASMALWTYVLASRKDADFRVVNDIRQAMVKAASGIVQRTRESGYLSSMKARDFVWGSNGVAAHYGMQLLVTDKVAPDARYAEAALDDLHYLLGRNPFSLSWVTQLGANPVRHPHHRPSGSAPNAEPWPGLLSGGPNANRQDPVLKALPDLPPAKLYRDDQDSYSSNEVAINWQAMLAFLLAAQLQQ